MYRDFQKEWTDFMTHCFSSRALPWNEPVTIWKFLKKESFVSNNNSNQLSGSSYADTRLGRTLSSHWCPCCRWWPQWTIEWTGNKSWLWVEYLWLGWSFVPCNEIGSFFLENPVLCILQQLKSMLLYKSEFLCSHHTSFLPNLFFSQNTVSELITLSTQYSSVKHQRDYVKCPVLHLKSPCRQDDPHLKKELFAHKYCLL